MLGGLGTPNWPLCSQGGHAAWGWRRWGLPGKGLKIQGLGFMEVWSQGA